MTREEMERKYRVPAPQTANERASYAYRARNKRRRQHEKEMKMLNNLITWPIRMIENLAGMLYKPYYRNRPLSKPIVKLTPLKDMREMYELTDQDGSFENYILDMYMDEYEHPM